MTGVPATGPGVPGLPEALAAWGAAGAAVVPLGSGLINHTFTVDGPGGRFVLQRLHPVFSPEVNEDIDVVTRHVAAGGLLTPRLLRTADGRAWCEVNGQVWRALSWIDGISLDRLGSPAEAGEAGALLGRFHCAVGDLHHQFRAARVGVHDTPRHLARLRDALDRHRNHPRYAAVAPLAGRILAAAAALAELPATPERVVHGDPKINNILFTPDHRHALCLIDLDTLARMPLPLELGDALRSWCNPAGEDEARSSFALELFEAAVGGYAAVAGGLVTAPEWQAIVAATETIYVELAARFCADALNESYFAWDARRHASASEHNQVRAESQLRAAASLAAQRAAAQAVVRAAFGA